MAHGRRYGAALPVLDRPAPERPIPSATPSPLKVLTRREARIVEALAETVFPPGDDRAVSPAEAGVVAYLDELLATVEPRERALMRALLVLFEVQTLVTSPLRPSLFTRASPEVRTRSLRGWDKSSLYPRRVAFQAIRSLMLWAYVDNPTVERAMGVERGTRIIARLREQGWPDPPSLNGAPGSLPVGQES
jgi:hypothetical protein